MRRKIGTLALIVAAFGLGQASAQATIPDGVFVRDGADNTWLVSGGMRSVVPIYSTSDADIMALPESGRWVVPAKRWACRAGGPASLGRGPGAAPGGGQAAKGRHSARRRRDRPG